MAASNPETDALPEMMTDQERKDFYKELSETHQYFIAQIGYDPKGCLSDITNCETDPGHAGFKPLNEFQISDIPSDWLRDTMYDFITATAKVTVRIRGQYVSPERPDGYTMSERRGKRINAFGTGRVHNKPSSISPCPCSRCDSRSGTEGYKCLIITANHVIFDSLEAAKASVDFYVDHPTDRTSVVNAEGWKMVHGSTETDWCIFYCLFHSETLSATIESSLKEFHELCNSFKKAILQKPLPYHFIVSHPHGLSKHVSFGTEIKRVRQGKRHYYQYNTATCPGTSGAFILDHYHSRFSSYFAALNITHAGIDGHSRDKNRSSAFPEYSAHI